MAFTRAEAVPLVADTACIDHTDSCCIDLACAVTLGIGCPLVCSAGARSPDLADWVLRRRNEIVSLNLVVNCAMLCFATVSGVTGTFGMNFSAWMPQDHSKSLVGRRI